MTNEKLSKTIYPVFDMLEERLEDGCEIKKQDGLWWLFDRDGNGICCGKTILEMLTNLIFTDC